MDHGRGKELEVQSQGWGQGHEDRPDGGSQEDGVLANGDPEGGRYRVRLIRTESICSR